MAPPGPDHDDENYEEQAVSFLLQKMDFRLAPDLWCQ